MDITEKKIERILSEYGEPKKSLACILEDIQMEFGAITAGAIEHISGKLGLAVSYITDVLEKQKGLVMEKDIRIPVEICTCPACKLQGGQELSRSLGAILLINSCAGNIGSRYYISQYPNSNSPCHKPPTVRVNGKVYEKMDLPKLLKLLEPETREEKSVQKPRVASF